MHIRSIVSVVVAVTTVVSAAGLQKLNLYGTSTPRFTLTDRVWPAAHGDAHVCLWYGDRYAAASVSIDDNIVEDHAWWKAQGEEYGFRFTWFVMPDQLDAAGWASFRDLHAAGHDLQIHDVCDINNLSDADYAAKMEANMAKLESNVPGTKAVTYAYPCGTDKSSVVSHYYIAARGVVGYPNAPHTINYLNTTSAKIDDCWLHGILGDASSCTDGSWQANGINAGNYDRGWLSAHYHGEVGAGRDLVNPALATMKELEDEIWCGTWTEVAKYGQERDTHELIVTSVDADAITFTLSDDMKDDLFDFPLTVKIRVNNDWRYGGAVQDGEGRTVEVVEHDGNKYALVDAVPDRGTVTVTKADASGMRDGRHGMRTVPGEGGLLFDTAGRVVDAGTAGTGMYILNMDNTITKIIHIK